jgi:hypothetical protein
LEALEEIGPAAGLMGGMEACGSAGPGGLPSETAFTVFVKQSFFSRIEACYDHFSFSTQ